ncbi:MAG: DUF4301 family protein [Cellulophaga sp.]
MSLFTKKDISQLSLKGIDVSKALEQIETFKNGIPYVTLDKAAVISDGVLKFSLEEEESLIASFEEIKSKLSLLKFVPASGAASRMFKALFNFLEVFDYTKERFETYCERTDDKAMVVFYENMEKFPFYERIKKGITKKTATKGETVYLFVEKMLLEEGFNYGFFPKGLLPFHSYIAKTSTPFEEHLVEASLYATKEGRGNLHFTISEQHTEMFVNEFATIKNRVSKATEIDFNVDYSYQKSKTDTIAVTMNNEPFRNKNGSLLLRPAGHGALIENLNEQNADIIFIKNIDNVVVLNAVGAVADSKKVLAGHLLNVQAMAFKFAASLEDETVPVNISEIRAFVEGCLNVRLSIDFSTLKEREQKKVLIEKLNRPIRVCGMVKNEGEPGGGPFWIRNEAEVSLQIIESAQIDTSKEDQAAIVKNATHFNPVDLVCGIKNYKGEKYDLLKFVDSKQGFISSKTKAGKDLKALELPGLWNGAMAFWNTIFIEVPLVTFNPVKTVNDLVKSTHLAR